MTVSSSNRSFPPIPLAAVALGTALSALMGVALPASAANKAKDTAAATSCAGDNGGLALSPGFCATIFADNIGHARHMAVAADGTVYVNTWSGRYYSNDKPPDGGFLVALKDSSGSGHADLVQRFGDGVAEGSAGGTGIALYKGAVYAEQNDRIIRYALTAGEPAPKGAAQTVVSGLPLTGDHPMHPFVIDAKGQLFVDLGSATNDCEKQNRMPNSLGNVPCTEKETRGGIWRYDANKTEQNFSPAERYAAGIRNGEGMAFDAQGRLFVTQHGRDQLSQNWSALYEPEQGPELPAEEIVELKQGADYGWPECYFDAVQKKLVLGPEYGGNGGRKIGVCAERSGPVAFFPAHWAPNDLTIVHDAKFPAAYRNGAFVAFHGSWNRSPAPQGGYNVVFQPMTNGKASAPYVVFADGFAGAIKEPGRAAFRPTGLASGPNGALYISDDMHGRIWRVTYTGTGNATVAAAPAVKGAASGNAGAAPPEGTHADAGRQDPGSLPVPAAATKEQVALGERIFHGEVSGGTCGGCHGSDAKGSPIGPDLTSGKWLWGDGSVTALADTITHGVMTPKEHPGAMPPKGGAPLSDSDVQAVAAYVWAIGHAGKH